MPTAPVANLLPVRFKIAVSAVDIGLVFCSVGDAVKSYNQG